ncbi:helix-turn-helix domain-containing protein [Microbacterium maritypicum]
MWDYDKAKSFGASLKSLRHEHQLTQEQLAHASGLTKNQIQLFEAGKGSGAAGSVSPANPTLASIVGLSAAFDMSVSEFFAAVDM